MQPATDITFDAASALIVGQRDHQEDAVITDFPIGSDTGVIVLSDGMGGHAAGDVASKIVMTEVFCELKFQSGDPDGLADNARTVLSDALHGANDCLAAHIEGNPHVRGMGATLLAALFQGGHLHWVSVGDSPLYLYRDGMLRQLNEDHSMAPQIDLMAASGMMDQDTARDHPDRNALTSVLAGCEVAKIDSPEEPFDLRNGDIVIAASDGLQSLEDNRIASLLRRLASKSSAEIARGLLDGIAELDDPEQDNTSIAVVRIAQANAPDIVADAVRSAVNFAEGFDGDVANDAWVATDTTQIDPETKTVDEPADPGLAAAIAAVTAMADDPEDDDVLIDNADLDADTDDGTLFDRDEAFPSEEDTDDETDGSVLSFDSELPEDEEDDETLNFDVPADLTEEDVDEGEELDTDAAPEPDAEPDPEPETLDMQEALEENEPEENIFGLGLSPDDASADESETLADIEDTAFPSLDEDGAEDDAEDRDPGEPAMVSLRAEPRNERRPGAPILRRIVVEASR